MIPSLAASIPTYARILLKNAPPDRSRFLPTFAQTGISTQNATIELVVWVCGFLIVVVIASPFVHKYIQKLRECEEPVDKDAMLADFRAAYRAGQMDEAEFRRITELINNPITANPATLKAGSLRPAVDPPKIDASTLEQHAPATKPPDDAQPTAPIDSARSARDDTALVEPSPTSAAGDSLVDSRATHEP